MSTNDGRALSLMWQGDGNLHADDTLLAPMAVFIGRGIVPGDTVELTHADKQYTCEVLVVTTDESLIIHHEPRNGEADVVLPVGPVSVRILRALDRACPVCEKKGVVKELIAERMGQEVTLTHMHCSWCESEIPADSATINCPACIEKMRAKLLRDHTDVDQELLLFNGKRTVRFRPRCVEDGDAIQSYQDAMVLGNPGLSTQYVLNETKKAALALTLMDDGTGKAPLDAVTNPDVTPRQRVLIAGKHFKAMNQGYYDTLLAALGRFESLIEDACRHRIDEDIEETELLVLGEQIATSPDPVIGVIRLFEGLENLHFCVPTTEQFEEAEAMAETIIQENKEVIMEGRAKFIIAWCRMACYFRGDSKVQFKEETIIVPGPDGKPTTMVTGGLTDRLQYLGTLPMALYYLYLSSHNAWKRRVAKASDVEITGKF